MTEIDDKRMVAYLLGELPEEEQARLAAELFATPGYEQLQAVEEELIEAYVRGELAARARVRFEQHFLAVPHRRERVAFARTLLTVVTERVAATTTQPTPAPGKWQNLLAVLRPSNLSWAQAALAVGVLVALLTTVLLLRENQRLRRELARDRIAWAAERTAREAREQQLQQRIAGLPSHREPLDDAPVAPAPTPLPSSSTFTFALSPLVLKGSAGNRITIPPGKQWVQIRLELERVETVRAYQTVLQRAEGGGLRQIDVRRATAPAADGVVVVRLRAALFTPGDYILTLKSAPAADAPEVIADYQFTIAHR